MDDVYKFVMDSYTPETIPMARLAEYVGQLAVILGEQENVHLVGIESGSLALALRVEREAAPKVRENLRRVYAGDARPEVNRAYKNANEMLRGDNAKANLGILESNVLQFPGRDAARAKKIGPFTQDFEQEGVLVRIGKLDKTTFATIQEFETKTRWSFRVSKELAIQLAPFLFGPALRLIGSGRFYRDESGEWQHEWVRAERFVKLNSDSLEKIVKDIREFPNAWRTDIEPMEMLRSMRRTESDIY